MTRCTWLQRIERANALASRSLSAGPLLRFYAGLLVEQQRWLFPNPEPDIIRTYFPELLDFVERSAPPELVAEAARLRAAGPEEWQSLVLGYWLGGPEDEHDFFARAFLEPFAATHFHEPAAPVAQAASRCPCCERAPQAGALRPDAEGARRFLVCSFCAYEWPFPRIVCPGCREQEFDLLPVFHAPEFPHLRVEACDQCKTYLLSVDLASDPAAVPLVDDIAAVPLHLWAREQGYHRLQPNLTGI